VLTLAPSSSFVPLPDIAAERRMYLPIVGLVLTIVALVPFPVRDVTTTRVCGFSVVTLLALACFYRAGVWSDRFTFWSAAAEQNPNNARALFGLGSAYLERKQYEKGLAALQRARVLGGDSPPIRADIALAYRELGELTNALNEFRTLSGLLPTAKTFTDLGLVEVRLGYADQAILDFDQALRRDARYAPAYAYRSLWEAAADRRDAAMKDFRKAVELDPKSEITHSTEGQLSKMGFPSYK
jgi:tetratricopeptide (TPR) repeat protein